MSTWREKADRAREIAKDAANKATEKELGGILDRADELDAIFDKLKLTDPEVYDELIAGVEKATQQNLSLAAFVGRLQTLAAAGQNLINTLGNISGAEALRHIKEAIQDR